MNAWYQIRVRGELDPQWAEWFDGMTIAHPAKNETLLRGPVRDQAVLYGMLNKLRNLGLELIAVERIRKPNNKKPPRR